MKHPRVTLTRMLYAAKCYWPGVTDSDLEQVAERAADTGLDIGQRDSDYLGSLLLAADDLVLCLSAACPGPRSSRPATGSASLANGSWTRPGSAKPAPPGRSPAMIKRLTTVITGKTPIWAAAAHSSIPIWPGPRSLLPTARAAVPMMPIGRSSNDQFPSQPGLRSGRSHARAVSATTHDAYVRPSRRRASAANRPGRAFDTARVMRSRRRRGLAPVSAAPRAGPGRNGGHLLTLSLILTTIWVSGQRAQSQTW